jgi:hypothetical protein
MILVEVFLQKLSCGRRVSTRRRNGAVSHVCSNRIDDYFVSGQPLSLAVKKALSPGTTASCL